MITVTGKISWFGGPKDAGVGSVEGLALIGVADLSHWRYRHLFASVSAWDNSKGLAKNLNPNALYCAMRWNELNVSVVDAQEAMVRVIAANGKYVWLQPCDYGPGDGKLVDGVLDPDTGRIIDVSPGALDVLGIQTDAQVTCEVYAGLNPPTTLS